MLVSLWGQTILRLANIVNYGVDNVTSYVTCLNLESMSCWVRISIEIRLIYLLGPIRQPNSGQGAEGAYAIITEDFGYASCEYILLTRIIVIKYVNTIWIVLLLIYVYILYE